MASKEMERYVGRDLEPLERVVLTADPVNELIRLVRSDVDLALARPHHADQAVDGSLRVVVGVFELLLDVQHHRARFAQALLIGVLDRDALCRRLF